MLKAMEAEVLIQVNNGFGVRLRSKRMPVALQSMPDLFVVVYLAIEYNLDGAIFVAKRLMAGSQVDDR